MPHAASMCVYILNVPRVFAAIPGTTLHAQGQAFLGSSAGGSCQDLAPITSKFVIGFRTNLAVQSQVVLSGPRSAPRMLPMFWRAQVAPHTSRGGGGGVYTSDGNGVSGFLG